MESTPQNEFNPNQTKKYWAFISYSSHDANRWAIPLRKRLESYRIPIKLVGKSVKGDTIPKRLRPIFRDREQLAAGHNLSQRIIDGLKASRYLIVICSPRSKASVYVNKEIQWFKQNGGADRILPYIVEGDPRDCFPDALRYELDEDGELTLAQAIEPLAADARPGHDGKDAPLKILAGILDVNFNELKQRELLLRWRQLIAICTAAISLALVLGGLTTWAFIERNRADEQTGIAKDNEITAKQQRDRAEAERELAESRLYINDVQRAQSEWDTGDPAIAIDKLRSAPLKRRSWEHDYLNTLTQRGHVTLKGHTYHISHVSINADGSRVLSTSGDHTLRIWDATSGRELFTFGIKGILVKLAAFSSDGGRILCLDSDATLRLWDAISGGEIRSSGDRNLPITDASFSPDGKQVLVLARDTTGYRESVLAIWNAVDGKELIKVKSGDRLIAKASFTPDGKQILIVDRNAEVRVVDPATGNTVKSVRVSEAKNIKRPPTNEPVDPRTGMTFDELRRRTVGPRDRGYADDNLVFSIDGKRAVTKTRSLDPAGRYQIRNLETGTEIGEFTGHGIATSLQFSPDGRLLLTAGDDHLLKVWDASSAQLIHTLTGHRGWIRSAAFSPDGLLIASAGYDKTLKVWDVTTGRELGTLKGHTNQVTAVAFSSDGRRLVSGSDDKTLKIWDLSDLPALPRFIGHSHRVTGVAFSPDERLVASLSADGTLKVWDTASRKEIRSIDVGNAMQFDGVAFSPDGTRIVAAAGDKAAKVWEVFNGKILLTLAAHKAHVYSVAYSPDGRRIATGAGDNNIIIWESDAGRVLKTLKGHTFQITRVVFSPDGKRLASSSGDHTVKLWDTEKGEEIFTIPAHEGWVSSVAFSPNGMQLISTGGSDQTLKLWDATSGQPLRKFLGHSHSVSDATFTHDGNRVVSVGWDKDMKLWDVKSGQEILTLRGHSEPVECIALRRDGRGFVTGSVDMTLILWDASEALDVSSNANDVKPRIDLNETVTREGHSLQTEGDENILVNNSHQVARIARDGERLAKWAQPDKDWHTKKADESESKGLWFAARFHLERLAGMQPNNPSWKPRLESARAKYSTKERN